MSYDLVIQGLCKEGEEIETFRSLDGLIILHVGQHQDPLKCRNFSTGELIGSYFSQKLEGYHLKLKSCLTARTKHLAMEPFGFRCLRLMMLDVELYPQALALLCMKLLES
ncbi:hypothetical protein F0562_014516 [Nyssa sinensis]|uniref:Uncharacterized protein n=1 Tax=Nyssa sinensis TaxID=561372 RepID=A0A5J4ZP30_9ASTE|nr:hypothetical protein F0562_014516 [Nyssa sinensis]